MSKYNKELQQELEGIPSALRVFGRSSIDKWKKIKHGTKYAKMKNKNKSSPVNTENSVHAISTPFGGMNKRY